jgi:hypothetical protein
MRALPKVYSISFWPFRRTGRESRYDTPYSCCEHSIRTSHGLPHTGHFRSRASPIAPKASQQLLHHVPRVLQSPFRMDCESASRPRYGLDMACSASSVRLTDCTQNVSVFGKQACTREFFGIDHLPLEGRTTPAVFARPAYSNPSSGMHLLMPQQMEIQSEGLSSISSSLHFEESWPLRPSRSFDSFPTKDSGFQAPVKGASVNFPCKSARLSLIIVPL